MIDFKDIIRNDIKNTFLNNLEFAEEKEINGILMPVIDDGNILKETETQTGGIFENSRTIYVSEEYMKRPKQGSMLTMDGQKFIVVSAVSSMGMIEIVIQRNSGR